MILFKLIFLGSRFRRLDDAFVLLVSLMFLSNRKVSFLSDKCLDYRMDSVWWILLVTMPSGLRSQTRFNKTWLVGNHGPLFRALSLRLFSIRAAFSVSHSLLHVCVKSFSIHNLFLVLSSWGVTNLSLHAYRCLMTKWKCFASEFEVSRPRRTTVPTTALRLLSFVQRCFHRLCQKGCRILLYTTKKSLKLQQKGGLAHW